MAYGYKVLWVENLDYTAPEIIGTALQQACEQSEGIMETQHYLGLTDEIKSVAVIVDEDADQDDEDKWKVGIFGRHLRSASEGRRGDLRRSAQPHPNQSTK